jgi:mono/diheme cytochrome c family protein
MKALKTTLIVMFAGVFAVACSSDQQANHNQNSNRPPEVASAPSTPAASPAPTANANDPAKEAAKPAATDEKKDDKKKDEKKPDTTKPSPKIDAAALFGAQRCAGCHGADGKGKMKGAPDFTDAAWQKKETDAEFAAQIKNGKKPMPAYGDKLSEDEIKALVSYVRSFAKK